MQSTLSVCNISCTRGRRELFTNLSFRLTMGESLCVQGANGAGKTSLLRIIAGLAEPDSGAVHWQGKSIATQKRVFKQNLLYLGFQNNLKLSLSPLENLQLSMGIEHGLNVSKSQLIQALSRFGLNRASLLNSPCFTLSAGQQRRVALTRLSLLKAVFWVLDEPFTALDQEGILWVKEEMERHLTNNGIILYTSHLAESNNNSIKL